MTEPVPDMLKLAVGSNEPLTVNKLFTLILFAKEVVLPALIVNCLNVVAPVILCVVPAKVTLLVVTLVV